MGEIAPKYRPRLTLSPFERSVVDFFPKLRGLAERLAGCSDVVDDLVQQTFIKACRSQHQFRSDSNLHGWLFMILKNTYFGERRKKRREVFSEPLFNMLQDRMQVSAPGESSALEILEKFRAIIPYLSCLPNHKYWRDLLIATQYLSIRYEDAATIFEIPVGTVKSRIVRAKQALFDSIERKDCGPYNLSAWERATDGIPPDDRYFPIAQAYERLFLIFSSPVLRQEEGWEIHEHRQEMWGSTALFKMEEYAEN